MYPTTPVLKATCRYLNASTFCKIHIHIHVGVPEQALGWFHLDLGSVVEEPSEFHCKTVWLT